MWLGMKLAEGQLDGYGVGDGGGRVEPSPPSGPGPRRAVEAREGCAKNGSPSVWVAGPRAGRAQQQRIWIFLYLSTSHHHSLARVRASAALCGHRADLSSAQIAEFRVELRSLSSRGAPVVGQCSAGAEPADISIFRIRFRSGVGISPFSGPALRAGSTHIRKGPARMVRAGTTAGPDGSPPGPGLH